MKKDPNNLSYELTLTCRPPSSVTSEVLKGFLLSLGVPERNIVESEVLSMKHLSVYFPRLDQARMFRGKLKQGRLTNVSLRIKSWQEKDWKNKWKQEFVPFLLTKKVTVVPAWKRRDKRFKNKNTLIIDNSFAFGTGQHPTTRFLCEMIEEMAGSFTSFLDVGTGTGILAMLAAKNGAGDIRAIDLDRFCIQRAKENFKLNHCGWIHLDRKSLETFRPSQKYDFVAANLATFDLIENRYKLLRFVKPKKYLAVSGISVNNYDLLRKQYKSLPLRCIKIRKKEGWVALLFKKR